jgi:hypothetical protein
LLFQAYLDSSGVGYYYNWEFGSNSAGDESYADIMATNTFYSNGGRVYWNRVCPDGTSNFGRRILRGGNNFTYVYPANLSQAECAVHNGTFIAHTQYELEAGILNDQHTELANDIYLTHEVAILAFTALTGVVIDGRGHIVDGRKQHRCFYLANSGLEVTFFDLVIVNCYADSDSYSGSNGAGIFVGSDVTLTLRGVTISNCSAISGYGGGLYLGTGGVMSVLNSTFVANEARFGAGIYVRASSGIGCSLKDTSLVGNRAERRGAGLHAGSGATVNLERCTVHDNEITSTSNSDSSSGYHGAGCYFGSSTKVSILNSFITHNAGAGWGSGFIAWTNSVVELTDTIVKGNICKYRGCGAYNYLNAATISGSIFASNSGGNYGGGLYMTNSSSLELSAYMFYDNYATDKTSSDIYAGGSESVSNGCPTDAPNNFGHGILHCSGCNDFYYPANLSLSGCEANATTASVSTGFALESVLQSNRVISLEVDVYLDSEVVVLGFTPLTGVVVDGQGRYKIDGQGQHRCFFVGNAATELTLRALNVSNCAASASYYVGASSGTLFYGGAVFVDNNAIITIVQSALVHNSAPSGNGGGLYVGIGGSFTAINSTFAYNSVPGDRAGAGFYLDTGAALDINGLHVRTIYRGRDMITRLINILCALFLGFIYSFC